MPFARVAAAAVMICFVMASPPAVQGQDAPSAPIILKGAPMGGVKFPHFWHMKVAGKCEACHHPSRLEKPLKEPQEPCGDCHTRTATPPMRTKHQAAFHNPSATAGLCIDCHKTENASGRAAPVKCVECHKPENR